MQEYIGVHAQQANGRSMQMVGGAQNSAPAKADRLTNGEATEWCLSADTTIGI